MSNLYKPGEDPEYRELREYNFYLQIASHKLGNINLTDAAENKLIKGELYLSDKSFYVESIYNNNQAYSSAVLHFHKEELISNLEKIMKLDKNHFKQWDEFKLSMQPAKLFCLNDSWEPYVLFRGYVSWVETSETEDISLGLEAKSNKLQEKPLLSEISPTCRAVFGDKFCKVDRNAHAARTKLLAIEAEYLKIERLHHISKYARAKLVLDSREINISSLDPDKIYISREELRYFTKYDVGKQLKIIPQCDKKFSTCCNKFNNAVNFRGEPHVPNKADLEI
jgi:hypothetical protein